MLKENQKDVLRSFKRELREAAQRKARVLKQAQAREAQADTWEAQTRRTTPLK